MFGLPLLACDNAGGHAPAPCGSGLVFQQQGVSPWIQFDTGNKEQYEVDMEH